jgi:hypothetical protein
MLSIEILKFQKILPWWQKMNTFTNTTSLCSNNIATSSARVVIYK